MKQKRLAILGSTGSIGTQTLTIVEENPERFQVEVLTANNNLHLLITQARKFVPNVVVIGNELHFEALRDALEDLPIKVYAGQESIAQVVSMGSVDIVLTALVGISGLIPTIEAIKAKKTIALANKETLVVAGKLIQELVAHYNAPIYPVDSEHSAIFQCLAGEMGNPVEKIYLTASGGPFRTKDAKFLEEVTVEMALNHPNWDMGNKITIDSATFMNKGFEAIEARWLFDLKPEQIDVIVHPQSIVHSLVQFADGSMKAQMGLPDMKLPILYALTYPDRIQTSYPRFNFMDYPELTFHAPDRVTFPCLEMAYEAMKREGNTACVVNAANEIAVEAFLNKQIKFSGIPRLIEQSINKISYIAQPTLADYLATDQETREFAKSIIE
ncbi:MAG: 1-deoxy-D-xylulose-5-phosphate reductoisomerase [Bacteroidales bacterium]|jgi:1-deoxy-D-xylulose-5-phosphate reductoisomerase